MKAIISLVIGFLLSFTASANDFAAAVGFRSNSADGAVAGQSVSSKSGIGAGVIGFFDMASQFQIRTGFLYNQRNVSIKDSGVEADLDLSYVDVPITGMYKFADYAGAFAGPVLALLASKDCKIAGGCSYNPEGMVLGFQFGASFKFAPQLGAEVYYEMLPSQYWKGALKNGRTVGVNLLFTFE